MLCKERAAGDFANRISRPSLPAPWLTVALVPTPAQDCYFLSGARTNRK